MILCYSTMVMHLVLFVVIFFNTEDDSENDHDIAASVGHDIRKKLRPWWDHFIIIIIIIIISARYHPVNISKKRHC